MGAILDIIFSLAIRGAIVLAIMNMTVSLQQKLSEKTAQAKQLNLVSTVSLIMRNDFEKVGYNWTSGPPYFSYASSDTVEFVYSTTQPPGLPTACSVRYYLGSTSELASTDNASDRILYKRVNGGTPQNVAVGVVKMKFQYFDSNGNPIANAQSQLSSIKSFSVDLIMASGSRINGFYPASEWYYRFFPTSIN